MNRVANFFSLNSNNIFVWSYKIRLTRILFCSTIPISNISKVPFIQCLLMC
ncbi:unnamed protein product [Gulo gulo]|uniref:Uncharacterized protein n=1 Tax=Gulo gulo TaxID=48420 RepID=A0A9X9LV30_GULGU|nr:unnamed protein product [Gulo gulo]